jgi:hypothetical protein
MDINRQVVNETAIDRDKVSAALIACEIGGPAKEEASRLVDGWLEALPTFPEVAWKKVFVECPFYIQLDERFYVVGQMDGVFDDGSGIVLAEWKSRRAPKLKKDGTNYLGEDEEGWLTDISNGPQLGVYALAGREGKFLDVVARVHGKGAELELNVPEPRILVRAAIKSNPVEIWPSDYRKGLFTFPGKLLDTVRAALMSEAVSIRARRKLGMVPYSVPGLQCTNMYHRTCEYLETVCRPKLTPPAEPMAWRHPADTAPDPGFDVTGILGLDIHDPELVVLSASALVDNYQCAEKARIDYGGYFAKAGDQFELNVGTGLHRGLAAIYRQWPK